MEITHLKYFIEVARLKSFSKAALSVHVSQSVISKLVKDLERELGAALFHRNAKQVSLTDFGAAFLTDADQVVTLFNNLSDNVASKFQLPKGKVAIGLPLMTDAATFAQFLGTFRRQYPEIDTQLYEYGSKKVEAAVQEGLVDIGIICRQPGSPDIFDSFPFSRDPLKVVIHPQHPLAAARQVRLAALSQEPFILSSGDFSLHDEIVKSCQQAGFKPQVVLETSQRELMVQAVAANLGITLIPGNVCKGFEPGLVASVPLIEPEIIHSMSVIWKRNRPLSYPAKLCLAFAKDHLLAPPGG